jgi:hypothetical protein
MRLWLQDQIDRRQSADTGRGVSGQKLKKAKGSRQ